MNYFVKNTQMPESLICLFVDPIIDQWIINPRLLEIETKEQETCVGWIHDKQVPL
jgi:hypothetical protein